MNPDLDRPAGDTAQEIAALIETLHDTEQRLEALTVGQVDTVANRNGRTLLMRRAQEGLWRTDAEKQAAIVNALPAHVALIDASGTVISVNNAWRRFATANGWPDANYGVGRNYLDVCHAVVGRSLPEAREVASGIQSVLRGELGQYSVEYACHSSTDHRWFLMTATPLAGQSPGGAIVMHVDITERTLATLASRQTAALLQAVADGTPDQVYVKNLQGRYLLCNRAVADYMGVPIEQLLGRDSSMLADDDQAALQASDYRVLETGRADTSEYSLTRNGQSRTFHTTKAPYRNALGELIGVLGISRDVTERRQAELARDNERMLLRTLIDALPDVVYTKDASGHYVIGNRAALAQFGMTQEHELIGKTAFDVLPPAAAERAHADDLQVLAGQAVLHRVDRGAVDAGLPEWSSVVKVPLRDPAGRVMGLVGFRRDISEYRRAQQDLIDQKSVLQMVGRIAKVGGWSLELPTWRVSWSDIVAELHDERPGYAPAPEETFEAYAPEHRALVRLAMERCATHGTTYELEAEKQTCLGRRFWVHTMGEAVRNSEGVIVRIQGAFQDITERKLAELERHKLAERLSNTLESITDGFCTVDRDWRYTHVNSQAEQLIQRSRSELLGRVVWEVFPAALGTVFETGYRRAMAGEKGVAFEALYLPWDRWLGVNCYPTDDGLSVYFRDVSAQRAARRRLELLEASVSQINDLVMIASADNSGDPALRIEFVNDAFVRASGHAREDLLGRSPGLLYGPQTDPAEVSRLRQAGERREPAHSELRVYRRDGEPYWIELDLVPIVVHPEDHLHWVIVGRDITERRRDQQALRELNAELEGRVIARTAELDMARDLAEQANRAKSSFLATMSHEIRTPMNGVIGMIDVLEQTTLRAGQLDIVRTARESAYSLLSIVDDVLDFSKIEAGQFQIDSEPISVMSVVEGTCDALDHLAASKGVALSLFVDPRLPERVLGDAARLRQVLMNLVGNAIKFSSGTARPGRVAVRALAARLDAQPALLEISVTDNGIGMDEATVACLFMPFTQADAGTTRRFGGTGLGLSISHRLVELMSGSIEVSSAPGQGTTFTLHLPMSPTVPQHGDVANWPELRGLRCVVLGANGAPADDLAVYLDHAGAWVQRATDRAAAKSLLLQNAPGRCVAIIADAGDILDTLLAECRATAWGQAGLALRFVVIEQGRRRKPRVKAADLVSLDGESLHRDAFLRAVVLAGSSALIPDFPDTAFGSEIEPTALRDPAPGMGAQAILVAEDNEINQKVLRKQLALLGFHADIAADGREALARWHGADYALLITDLHMPAMDGYELTMAIRAAETGRRRMPIAALTANAVTGEERRCREVGMDDYMTKPVQLSALKALLLRWLVPVVAAPCELTISAAARSGDDLQPASGPPPADLDVLTALIGDDTEAIAEVLALFRSISKQLRTQIRQGFASGRLQTVADAAHTLKSNARAIGALVFGQTCEDIEHEAASGNAEAVRDLLAAFEVQLTALRHYLDSVDPADAAGSASPPR